MALKLVILVALAGVLTEAYPRRILVPLANMPLVRQVRSVVVYPPPQQPQPYRPYVSFPVSDDSNTDDLMLPAATEVIEKRQLPHDGGGYGSDDHVDYGAYTGGYGAFGWYSDHPVCINCGYHGGYH